MSNAERPLPYYRFYVLDYRASRRVQRLTWQERGLYRELIDECWLKGAVPDDVAKLSDICGCPVGPMAEAWERLKPLFEPLTGMDGMFLFSPRLDAERSELDKLRAARVLAGSRGGKASSKLKQTVANVSKLLAVAEQSISSSHADGAFAPSVASATGDCATCAGRKGIHAPECPNA